MIMNLYQCKRCNKIVNLNKDDPHYGCGCLRGPSPWELIGEALNKDQRIEELEAEVARLREYEWKYNSLCK